MSLEGEGLIQFAVPGYSPSRQQPEAQYKIVVQCPQSGAEEIKACMPERCAGWGGPGLPMLISIKQLFTRVPTGQPNPDQPSLRIFPCNSILHQADNETDHYKLQIYTHPPLESSCSHRVGIIGNLFLADAIC